jgi:hypothetical protein
MTYEEIKSNYDKGLWGKAIVRMAVRKGIITAEQYEEITHEKY